MAELAGRLADVYWVAEDTSGTSFTNEACSDKGTTPARTIYQIDSLTKRYWKGTATTTVQTSPDGAVWTTVTDYQVGYAGGIIIFNSQRAVGTQVRASGTYFTPSSITMGTSWNASVEREVGDTTVFGSTWKTAKYTLSSGSATVESFHSGTAFWETLYPASVGGLLVLYLSQPGNVKIEVEVHLSGHSVKEGVDGILKQTATFQFKGPVNWAIA